MTDDRTKSDELNQHTGGAGSKPQPKQQQAPPRNPQDNLKTGERTESANEPKEGRGSSQGQSGRQRQRWYDSTTIENVLLLSATAR